MRDDIPLSRRSASELRAHAAKYRDMAATARTPEAMHGLETLAVRFADLSATREAQERGCQSAAAEPAGKT